MRKIVFCLFWLATGCNNSSADKKTDKENSKADTSQISSKLLDSTIEKDNNDSLNNVLYECKNDTLLQILAVKYITKKLIVFELTTTNKVKNETSTLTGSAKKGKSNQDPEMDEDSEGNAYPVTEYHYTKNECSLSIRIARDTKDRARVLEYGCNKLHEINTPFASVGVLKKGQD